MFGFEIMTKTVIWCVETKARPILFQLASAHNIAKTLACVCDLWEII